MKAFKFGLALATFLLTTGVFATELRFADPNSSKDFKLNSRKAAQNIVNAVPDLCEEAFERREPCSIYLGSGFFYDGLFTVNRNYPYNPKHLVRSIEKRLAEIGLATILIEFKEISENNHVIVLTPESFPVSIRKVERSNFNTSLEDEATRTRNSELAANNIVDTLHQNLDSSASPILYDIRLGPGFFYNTNFTSQGDYVYDKNILLAAIQERVPGYSVSYVEEGNSSYIRFEAVQSEAEDAPMIEKTGLNKRPWSLLARFRWR